MNSPDHIEHGMNNILNAENPDATWCHVVQAYSNDVFTGLVVSIGILGRNGFASFFLPQYFDGPFWWQGANFRTSSVEERDSFIKEKKMNMHDPSQYFLFEVTSQSSVIHIVARNISYTENNATFRQNEDEELTKRIDLELQNGNPIIAKSSQTPCGRTHYSTSSVDHVLALFQQGRHFEEILHMMPWLEPEDIEACLAYARQKLKT